MRHYISEYGDSYVTSVMRILYITSVASTLFVYEVSLRNFKTLYVNVSSAIVYSLRQACECPKQFET